MANSGPDTNKCVRSQTHISSRTRLTDPLVRAGRNSSLPVRRVIAFALALCHPCARSDLSWFSSHRRRQAASSRYQVLDLWAVSVFARSTLFASLVALTRFLCPPRHLRVIDGTDTTLDAMVSSSLSCAEKMVIDRLCSPSTGKGARQRQDAAAATDQD
jgi:hypothetical protein